MKFLDLDPISRAAGTVRLPGSKSISNRVLLLSALSCGDTLIRDLLDADDTRVMLEALERLGVAIERSHDAIVVHGVGAFPVKSAELQLGNAGTAFRPLVAALALNGGEYRLSGVARMHERPIGDLVDSLRRLGAKIDYSGKKGFPPLAIRPGAIRGSAVHVRGDVSSQYLSSLLMALPMTGAKAEIEVEGELISKPYVEITLNLMRRFGVEVAREGWSKFCVPAKRYESPGEIRVEGDASSASYFLAAGAIGGGPVRVEGLGRASIQGDVRFAEVLEKMGATVSVGEDWIESAAPARKSLKSIDADLNHIPDAAMTAAVAALFADGQSSVRNIASWRVKETDRIAAMAKELRKLGAAVEEGADFIRVTPPVNLKPTTIDTYGDHRVAMSFSLAALGGIRVRINDPGCVAKTFPEYFDALASITAPVIAIDGPSASGKGTVAQLVAKELGFHYLDSGALYRLVALRAEGTDKAAAAAFAAKLSAPSFKGDKVIFEGKDVSDPIRTEEVSTAASYVAQIPEVRTALLGRQRAFRRFPGLVAEGRDMGSVVFPYAEPKVFLTASLEARAERRYKQLKEKGIAATLAALLQDLRERDARDATRSASPLKKSPGARPLDTTSMSAEQAATVIAGWYRGANR